MIEQILDTASTMTILIWVFFINALAAMALSELIIWIMSGRK